MLPFDVNLWVCFVHISWMYYLLWSVYMCISCNFLWRKKHNNNFHVDFTNKFFFSALQYKNKKILTIQIRWTKMETNKQIELWQTNCPSTQNELYELYMYLLNGNDICTQIRIHSIIAGEWGLYSGLPAISLLLWRSITCRFWNYVELTFNAENCDTCTLDECWWLTHK